MLGVGAAVIVGVGGFNGSASAEGVHPVLERAHAAETAGDLPGSNLTIKSAISVDSKRDFATLPLHRATVSGVPASPMFQMLLLPDSWA